MRKLVTLFAFLSFVLSMQAQEPTVPDNFKVSTVGDKATFTPILPPLTGIPGAPAPFYTYYWEFGDGSFSHEEKPVHEYAQDGDFEARLYATNNYDDGDPPPGKSKKVPNKKTKKPGTALADATGKQTLPAVFADNNQAIALKNIRQARAKEELPIILSYANRSRVETGGSLHFFFNEKSFKTSHFDFIGARTHFGETEQPGYTVLEIPLAADWAALEQGLSETGTSAPLFVPAPVPDAERLLAAARGTYREERVWSFDGLRPDEARNLFLSIVGTPSMLKDTSAFIHFEAIFVPNVAGIAADRFVAELEIVSSHDPNNIAVSENRTSFRRFGKKDLDYKVKFQNNGEGPASTIQVSIDIPKGLTTKSVKPKTWYPPCPICPKNAVKGLACLDTTIRNEALIFTFRNIYLPGSQQKGITEYDSTKGFIKYNIVPNRKMSKRPFGSRAAIVFDKNPPVVTNKSSTRFRVGMSPGMKIAYNFDAAAIQSGYYLGGFSFSPYKSWRWYPQLEILVGLPYDASTDVATVVETTGNTTTFPKSYKVDSCILTTATRRSAFEIPVLFRKNITSWIGFGAGAGIKGGWDQINSTARCFQTGYFQSQPGSFIEKSQTEESTQEAPGSKEFQWIPFLLADLTLGAVRAGPNLGIRLQYPLKGEKKITWQGSVEFKF